MSHPRAKIAHSELGLFSERKCFPERTILLRVRPDLNGEGPSEWKHLLNQGIVFVGPWE